MKQVEVWQKVVDRRRAVTAALHGKEPLRTCGHDLGEQAYVWDGFAMCDLCALGTADPVTCEVCGLKPVSGNGVTETYPMENRAALPGFKGLVTATVCLVCDDCGPEIEDWSVGQWRLEAMERLWHALKRAEPLLAVEELGATAVICGIHTLGLERKITSTLCWEEHLRDPQVCCSVCGDFVSLDHVTEAFEIGEHAPLRVVLEEGSDAVFEWAGMLLVEPFAYVCERHLELWPRHGTAPESGASVTEDTE